MFDPTVSARIGQDSAAPSPSPGASPIAAKRVGAKPGDDISGPFFGDIQLLPLHSSSSEAQLTPTDHEIEIRDDDKSPVAALASSSSASSSSSSSSSSSPSSSSSSS